MKLAGLAMGLCFLVLFGCGTSELSASSTCSQFMQAEIAERAQITAQLYESHHGANSLAATNALLDTEAICRDEPTTQLGSIPVLSGSQ